MKSIPGLLFGGFFLLFWSSLTLAFDVTILYRIYRECRAQGYPTAPGVVTSSDVHSNGDTSRPDLKYKYAVQGVPYEGTCYRYGEGSSSGGRARRVADRLPVGRQVDVHYNPADPADAVLLCGVEGEDLFLLLFMTPFNLVMLGGWALAGGYLLRPLRAPLEAGAPLLYDGSLLRVRLTSFGPLTAALVSALGTSFALTFVLAFGCDGDPSVIIACCAWGAVLAVALIVHFGYSQRIASGRYDLVVDPYSRSMALPWTYGRKEELTIRFRDVTAVEMREEVSKRSDSPTLQHVVSVTYTAPDGSAQRGDVWTVNARDRAAALAAWIEKQLGGTGYRGQGKGDRLQGTGYRELGRGDKG